MLDSLALVSLIGLVVEAGLILVLYRRLSVSRAADVRRSSESNEDLLFLYEERIKEQNLKLADLEVKVGILESRSEGSARPFRRITQFPPNDKVLSHRNDEAVSAQVLRESSESGGSGIVVKQNKSSRTVLGVMLERDISALDVMSLLGCSREHAARMMKQLYVSGLVDRGGARPFVYHITSSGRKEVETSV